jgi:hypothetical protein
MDASSLEYSRKMTGDEKCRPARRLEAADIRTGGFRRNARWLRV